MKVRSFDCKVIGTRTVFLATLLAGPFGYGAKAGTAYHVCHGEFESVCAQHSYNDFEHCGDDNGVRGADPDVSIRRLCGQRPDGTPQGSAKTTVDGIGGNHCGYSWFNVFCDDPTS